MIEPVDIEPSTPFERSLVYASKIHAGQTRKGSGVPYVSHLLGVAALVFEDGGSETEAVAALLHDAAEDQGGRERLADIRRRFGDDVARIVDGCTDTYEQPKPPWRERKAAYIARLVHEPPEVLRVSLADKLYNVRTILLDWRRLGDAVYERFTGGKDDVLWYYRTIAATFRSTGFSSPMLDELERVVGELG